tara:strand:- start:476 stop:1873 length:1398 start_codon:yes stop_codon:yes gene_type:complete
MKAVSKISNNLNGEIVCPGDKSISQRSVILGSLLDTDIKISGFLFAEDPLSTVNAMRSLGNNIEIQDETVVIKNSEKSKVTKKVFCNLGNSGTGMRLIAGLIAGQKLNVELSGDESLSSRPMGRIVEPLIKMGAKIESNDGCAPLVFSESILLDEFYFRMPIASAQVKSCLLLAAVTSNMKLTLIEETISRDHTERMLKHFGADIDILTGTSIGAQVIRLNQDISPKRWGSPPLYEGRNGARKISYGSSSDMRVYDIPGDFSSASFLIVAALITKNSSIKIKNVGINRTRSALIYILKEMGGKIKVKNQESSFDEEVADIEVRSSDLNGITLEEEVIPKIIDEIPILSIAASFAKGTTVIKGVGELRFKESDRLEAILQGLANLGIDSMPMPRDNDITIFGNENLKITQDVNIKSFGDHRIAMSFLVAGLRSDAKIYVDDCKNIDTSFPSFFETFSSLGADIKTT